MKRFMLFIFQNYYPDGGMNDFKGSFDTLEAARFMETELNDAWSQSHIYDTVTGRIVE